MTKPKFRSQLSTALSAATSSYLVRIVCSAGILLTLAPATAPGSASGELLALKSRLQELNATKQTLGAQIKAKSNEVGGQNIIFEQMMNRWKHGSIIDKINPLPPEAPPELKQAQKRLLQLTRELQELREQLARVDNEIKSIMQRINQIAEQERVRIERATRFDESKVGGVAPKQTPSKTNPAVLKERP